MAAVDRKRIAVLLLVYAPFVGLALLTRLSHNPLVDEWAWHLPTIERFAEQLPHIDIGNYHTSSGPVPYIIWGMLGKLFGVDLRVLRLSTLLCGLGYVTILWRLLSREKTAVLLCVLAMIALNPYGLTYSFTIYTMVMSLFFASAGILALERATESRRVALLAVYSLFTALAVLSRQIYVSVRPRDALVPCPQQSLAAGQQPDPHQGGRTGVAGASGRSARAPLSVPGGALLRRRSPT